MSDKRDIEWFESICKKNSFLINDSQLNYLRKYVDLLIQKNKQVNLISEKSEQFIWEDHILQSISFLFKVKIYPHAKILDFGTGGGLPGIPLKILFPEMDVTLLDSTKKKIIAVNEILDELKLSGIKTITARAEEINNMPEYTNKFDYVIVRAVSTLKNILDWTRPFLDFHSKTLPEGFVPNSSILVLKGGDIDQEVIRVKRVKHFLDIQIVNLDFIESETLKNPDKKLIILKTQ